MSLLSISGLRKSFGDNVVLDGFDMDVAPGECVVLIGASGSGKSTLLRCVNLLETVDDGVIELAGQDITDPRVNPDQVRARMGMVFQAYNLFPHLSVLDNIMLAPVRVHRRSRAEAATAAQEILERVGLADKARVRPDELSGGQQQRVAIARALVNSPELMLLDEVTSALDPELVGGARPAGQPQGRRDDHGARDPRDGLRQGGRRPGLLPARRSDPRGGSAGVIADGAHSRAHPGLPRPFRRPLAPASYPSARARKTWRPVSVGLASILGWALRRRRAATCWPARGG